jgi:hypothetical protein
MTPADYIFDFVYDKYGWPALERAMKPSPWRRARSTTV